MIGVKMQDFGKLLMCQTDILQIVNIVYGVDGWVGFLSRVGFIYYESIKRRVWIKKP